MRFFSNLHTFFSTETIVFPEMCLETFFEIFYGITEMENNNTIEM